MIDELMPAVVDSIVRSGQDVDGGPFRCGCVHRHGERWHLCAYHDGFADGYARGIDGRRV